MCSGDCDDTNPAVLPGGVEVTCNGLDDDCDGAVDETFDLESDPERCGSCEVNCSVPEGLRGCVAGACEGPVIGCEPGYVDCNEEAADGCPAGFKIASATPVVGSERTRSFTWLF